MAQAGKQVFPVFQYRYGLAIRQLSALMDAGLAGRAYTASAETHWSRNSDYYAVPWRGTWAGEACGALLGHAIHAHDLLCHVLGPMAEVQAFTATRVNPIETEDCAAVTMRTQNGALITSSVTLGAATDTTRLRLCFEGFTAESGTAPYTPAEDTWRFTARDPAGQAAIDAVPAKGAEPLSGLAGFLEAVADALAGQGAGAVSFADGRRSIELVTALYASARSGSPVSLPLSSDMPLYDGWLPKKEGTLP